MERSLSGTKGDYVMAKRKFIIGIGDIVRIDNPEFFVRTRYEKYPEDKWGNI